MRGASELAVVIGLSDIVMYVVETGTTLRENNLRVIEKATKSGNKREADSE